MGSIKRRDLIDREAAIHVLNAYDDRGFTLDDVQRITDGCVEELRKLPSIEAEPVRHGRWILIIESVRPYETEIEEKCSLCGCNVSRYDTEPMYNFCPNCGARMDAKENANTPVFMKKRACEQSWAQTSGKNFRGRCKMKRVLDPCCGSKMFWFDKKNPDVEFCDIREVPYHEYYPGKYIEIAPDTVCDFTNLPFENDSFYLVVFDPPHLEWAGDTSIMALKYGKLTGNWQDMLTAGFNECMRVLKPNGVLIFKWSEIQFPLSKILPLFPQKPLFGNRAIKRGNKTHWLCFMKGE